jgi:hypothetical protein
MKPLVHCKNKSKRAVQIKVKSMSTTQVIHVIYFHTKQECLLKLHNHHVTSFHCTCSKTTHIEDLKPVESNKQKSTSACGNGY